VISDVSVQCLYTHSEPDVLVWAQTTEGTVGKVMWSVMVHSTSLDLECLGCWSSYALLSTDDQCLVGGWLP
jgi:hypothetical protein